MSDLPAAHEADRAARRRCQDVFDAEGFMATLGATLGEVRLGHAEISLPVQAAVAQHHGFAHAGAVTTILDTACGLAALTLMPPDSEVLTVDLTVHLPRPAVGEQIVAVADVANAGRRMTFVRAEAFAVAADGTRKVCALMTATMTSISTASVG